MTVKYARYAIFEKETTDKHFEVVCQSASKAVKIYKDNLKKNIKSLKEELIDIEEEQKSLKEIKDDFYKIDVNEKIKVKKFGFNVKIDKYFFCNRKHKDQVNVLECLGFKSNIELVFNSLFKDSLDEWREFYDTRLFTKTVLCSLKKSECKEKIKSKEEMLEKSLVAVEV